MFKRIILFALVISLLGCSKITFDGEIQANENHFNLKYNTFNDTKTHTLYLTEGDDLEINYLKKSGKVKLEISDENGNPIYSGSELTLDYFTLTIPKSGKYTINVEGKNASGELKILKVEHEMVNQASDLDSKNNLSPFDQLLSDYIDTHLNEIKSEDTSVLYELHKSMQYYLEGLKNSDYRLVLPHLGYDDPSIFDDGNENIRQAVQTIFEESIISEYVEVCDLSTLQLQIENIYFEEGYHIEYQLVGKKNNDLFSQKIEAQMVFPFYLVTGTLGEQVFSEKLNTYLSNQSSY